MPTTEYVSGVNHQAVEIVLNNSTAIGTTRFVLSLIARYANAIGKAEPSIETIAGLSGFSERGVEKMLSHLRDEGELTWETRRLKDGTNDTNLYTLPLLAGVLRPPEQSSVGVHPPEQSSEELLCNSVDIRKKKKTTDTKGSSPEQSSVGSSTGNDLALTLSLEFADALIKHRGKKARYRQIDAESVTWLTGIEKLLLKMTNSGPVRVPFDHELFAQVLDHAVTDDKYAQIKEPLTLYTAFDEIVRELSPSPVTSTETDEPPIEDWERSQGYIRADGTRMGVMERLQVNHSREIVTAA